MVCECVVHVMCVCGCTNVWVYNCVYVSVQMCTNVWVFCSMTLFHPFDSESFNEPGA